MGKLIFFAVILIAGGIGYYLWNQVPDTPKEQTLGGYTHALQNDEAKAKAVVGAANLENVQGAVHKFRADKGSLPADLQELVPNYIDHIPGGLQYDASTGTVSAAQ